MLHLTKVRFWQCGWLGLLPLLITPTMAAEAFTQSDEQAVRSVLERQNTLLHLNSVASARISGDAVKQVIQSNSALQIKEHMQLLALAKSIGMPDIENLAAPPYFLRVESQWQSLADADLERQYLLVALQCQSFIDRSMNAELRSSGSAALQAWIKQNLDDMDAAAREFDHALYDLK